VEGKGASRHVAVFPSQLEHRLGAMPTKKLSGGDSSEPLVRLEKPECGARRGEIEKLNGLPEPREDTSWGIRLELPSRITPLIARP
jgi:hypothetical protein